MVSNTLIKKIPVAVCFVFFASICFAQEVKGGVLTIKKGCRSIEENAYAERKDIKKVICPSSLEKIGPSAFKNCTSLASVSFNQGLKEIGYEAFAGCSSLSSVSLPDSVDTILGRAFADTGISRTSLPSSIQFVDANSFPNKIVPYDRINGEELKPIDIDFTLPSHSMPQDKYIVKKEEARVVNIDMYGGVYVNPLAGNKGNDGYGYVDFTLPVWDRDYQYIIEILASGASNYEIGEAPSGAKFIRATVGPVPVEKTYSVTMRFKLMQIPLEYTKFLSDKFPARYEEYEKFMLLPSATAGGCWPNHPYFQDLAAEFMEKSKAPPELAKRAFIYPWHHLYFDESCLPKTPALALAIGLGDCTEFSGLFITVCRACNIPARQISVSTFRGKSPLTVTRTNHSLSEVYMDPVGWFAVDSNLGGGSLVGKHRFGYIPPLQIFFRPEDFNYSYYPTLNPSDGSKLSAAVVTPIKASLADTGDAKEIQGRNKRKTNASLVKNKGRGRVPAVERYTKKEVLENLYANAYRPKDMRDIEIGINRLSPYEKRFGIMKEYGERDWITAMEYPVEYDVKLTQEEMDIDSEFALAIEFERDKERTIQSQAQKKNQAKGEPPKEGLIDGVLYIKDGKKEIFEQEFFRKSNVKKLVIPASVRKIDAKAFYFCNNLTEVEIPSSVEVIEASAFENCVSLKKVIFHEGLKVIGDSAFKNTAVTELVIPSSVTSVGNDVFAICTKLTSISVKKGSKAEEAFRGDKRITVR